MFWVMYGLAAGAVECDEFEHIICPPSTWKKLQEAMGKRVEKEGEYTYTYLTNWTGSDWNYPSVRALIAELTVDLEGYVAIGRRQVNGKLV